MEKELKIGETGVIDGIKVVCVEGYINTSHCIECAFFNNFTCKKKILNCYKFDRSDGKPVYFKKV